MAINQPASSWLNTHEALLRDIVTCLKDLTDSGHHNHLGEVKAHMGVRGTILADAAAKAVVTKKILDADLDIVLAKSSTCLTSLDWQRCANTVCLSHSCLAKPSHGMLFLNACTIPVFLSIAMLLSRLPASHMVLSVSRQHWVSQTDGEAHQTVVMTLAQHCHACCYCHCNTCLLLVWRGVLLHAACSVS